MKKLLFVLLVLSVFAVHAQVPSYVPTNGLVAYYPFNGNANDASGNGNNGVVNGATLTSDRNGNANNSYSFNGVNNFIELGNIRGLSSTNGISMSVWVKWLGTNGTTNHQYIFQIAPNPNGSIVVGDNFKIGSNVVNCNCAEDLGVECSIDLNIWHHVALTYDIDNGVLKQYFDGNLIGISQETAHYYYTVNNTPSRIGNYHFNSHYFKGTLDELTLFNRALSQSEITQLYNSNSCIANITNNDTSICRGSSITLNAAALNAASVTDINGNVYPSVNIGAQTWMQKNLNVSKYKNGDIIPQVTNATQWAGLTTGAWCWYNNDSATYAATYGKLYNWYAVNDPRGLAPEGWHVPSDGEWNKLVKFIDNNSDTICGFCTQSTIAGGLLKENGTSHWASPNLGATNSSNFWGLPAGLHSDNGGFYFIGINAVWWTSTEYDMTYAKNRVLFNSVAEVHRENGLKSAGLSIRALRNTPAPTYLWSTGATTPSITVSPTVTTKYYCTVSDGVNTCKDSVTVTVSTITTNLITADTIKVCGTSTTISATTGLSNYAWSNGANTASTTVTSSGWYKCTATNGACTAVDSVYVSLFNPKITQNDTTVCAGTPLTLSVNNNTALTSTLPANLRNGLVGYWPFNGNANDESGNGNHGTVNGATLTSDRFGNANRSFLFNGNQNNITISNLHQNNILEYSVAGWFKIDPAVFGNGGGTVLAGNTPLSSPAGLRLGLTGNRALSDCGKVHNIQWQVEEGWNTNGILGVDPNRIYNDNNWHQFVSTFSSNTGLINASAFKMYIDGYLISSETFQQHWPPGSGFSMGFNVNAPINNGTLPVVIGNHNGFIDGFKGNLDDISIYHRTLSATEVQQLYSGATYLWSTTATTQSINITPTATTSYITTVSNGINTCKDTVKITVATIATNIITADTIKVCGTSTTISATTGLASYAWSNGANMASTTVTSSGWYKCTATNGACTAVDSVYVSLFNPKITQNDTTVCAGTPLTLMVNNNTALTSSLPANLRNGLVGYWPFNGNANDESGNGNNGTVNGATLTSDRFGNVGKAYSFNGGSTINCLYPVISQNTSFSLSFWVNPNSISGIQEFLHTNVWPGAFYLGYIDGILRCGDEFQSTGVNISNQTWQNLIVVRDYLNGVLIYLNGQLVARKNSDINIGTAVPLVFGKQYGGNEEYYNGKLDDIVIFNRAISSTEVQQLYLGTSYLWSTTATTQSISVNPTATTSYIATVSNGINTCKDTVKITVANITSLAPTTIFGAVDVCAAIGGDTASVLVNYKINKIANAASYVWTVPAGATLLSGQGDTSIMVRFSASFVSGAITVKSVSTCNVSSAVKSVTVYKRVAAAPTAIQKEFTPTSIVATTNVSGLVSEVYRIKKVLYATSYNWYLNRGTNASITHINASGENDTAVIVTFASCFVKDTLSVKSVTPCSISAAKTVIMSSSTTPATVAGITTVGGDFAVCIGTSKTFTAIASTPTTTQTPIASFRWTKPVNTTITSATLDSSSITVSFNTGFTGGSLTAKGVSSCGVVGTVATAAVLQYLPPTPLSIASSTNSYNACINSSVTYTALVGTATTAQAQASVFRWTKPNNTTITSAATDSSSITLRFNTGYTGGVISVKGQSRCGAQSAARSQALTHTGCALGTKMSLPITTTNTPSFEVSLYPNPTASEFKLLIKNNTVVGSNKPSKAIVKVIDLQGRMIKSFQATTNQVIAIGNELKAGVYMVEVRLGEEVKTIRAVKF